VDYYDPQQQQHSSTECPFLNPAAAIDPLKQLEEASSQQHDQDFSEKGLVLTFSGFFVQCTLKAAAFYKNIFVFMYFRFG
jgi:hypothetical protein